MKIKHLKTVTFGLLAMQLIIPTFGASEVSEENTDQANTEYAPVNATEKEVAKAAPTDLVTIPDPKLEALLAGKLGVSSGSITVADMESLTTLNVSNNDITDITGLEYATGLTSLDIGLNEITDYSPISGLTGLTYLMLSDNPASDLSPIAGLTSLTRLSIGSDTTTDISPIAGLTSLTRLSINSKAITDVSAISGLTALTHLTLRGSEETDYSPLADCTGLTFLDMEGSGIEDLSPLSGLTSLKTLNLTSNRITDVSPLSGLTGLENLSLHDNMITDISPLKDMIDSGNLKILQVYNQELRLDNITVSNDDELIYNITNYDGSIIPVSLGVPHYGFNDMYKKFSVPMSSYGNFAGSIMQYVRFPELIGTIKATTTEQTPLSNEQLISLFGVVSRAGNPITVNQSKVDYNTPGKYRVIFSDDERTIISFLTVTDVMPTINVANTSATIEVGDKTTNLVNAFGATATEVTEGDLTSSITVDTSGVNYSEVGTYPITFTASDAEGNSVSASASLEVKAKEETSEVVIPASKDEEIVETQTDKASQVNNEVVESNVSSVKQVEETPKSSKLVKTGSDSAEFTIIFTGLAIALLVFKKIFNREGNRA